MKTLRVYPMSLRFFTQILHTTFTTNPIDINKCFFPRMGLKKFPELFFFFVFLIILLNDQLHIRTHDDLIS